MYIAGDNNLSPLAYKDLEEMKQGMLDADAAALHLLVYVDTGRSPRLVELRKSGNTVVEEVVREYEARNSCGVEETREVFDAVFSNPDFEAESYGLVYWSHCDGWIPYVGTRYVGVDETDGTHRMNISDLAALLRTAPHFSFIMFDACFMSSVEVAYELRGFTDYYIASPTETPGPGAPYDKLVPLMAEDDAAVRMAQAYFKHYNDNYNERGGNSNDNWTGGVSVCVIDTKALQELASMTAQVVPHREVDNAALSRRVFDYDQRWTSNVGYFDLRQLMQEVLDEGSFAEWEPVFDAAVAYWETTPKNYSAVVGMFSMEGTNGISQYIPGTDASRTAAYRLMSWYWDAGLSALGW